MKPINLNPLQLCLFVIVTISFFSFTLAMDDERSTLESTVPISTNTQDCVYGSFGASTKSEGTIHLKSSSLRVKEGNTDWETQLLLFNSLPQNRKVALVTGTTCGIGNKLTLELIKQGISVWGLSRDRCKLEAMKAENIALRLINQSYGLFDYICFDLSTICDPYAQVNLKARLEKCLGTSRINFLVHNAAKITPLGTEVMLESPIKDIQDTLTLNIMAPILLTRLLSDYYTDGSRILYVSSIAGDRPGGQTGLYSISKAAGDRYIQTQQKDKPRKGTIYFAYVNPGNVETDIHIRDLRTPQESFSRASYFQQFTGKLTSPEIVGQYLAWLLLETENEEFSNENKDWNKRKHSIYDKDQQKLWWKGEQINDPYETFAIVSPSILPLQDASIIPSMELIHNDMPTALPMPNLGDNQVQIQVVLPQGNSTASIGNPTK